ncbi:MAG: DUF2252 family protein [Chthoniobacteraceae bacterium]
MSKSHILPAGRKEFLDECRRLKMAGSAHAYVRGNTARFYEWLGTGSAPKSIPSGPAIWICGDCHIGNLGPVSDLEGNVEIQIRDLDQTVIGNPAHDLLRLGLSLAMAARSSDLPGITTALMTEILIESYLQGLTGQKPKASSTKIAPVQKVMRSALNRKWRHLAEERIEDVSPHIPLGPKFWPLTKEERLQLKALFETGEDNEMIQTLTRGHEGGSLKICDAAYWLKGCSSLGRVRYAVLIGVGKKHGRRFRLIDIKEATKAMAPHAPHAKMPANNAERVVTGARQLSPFLGDRMVPASLGNRQVVLRELRPQDLKFEFEGLSQEEAILTAGLLASVVGKAHGRQMKRPERTAWTRELKRSYSKKLDAPSWLWNGVVDLVAAHEASYLRHCRSYALSQARKSIS